MPTPVGHALGALIVTAPIRARYRMFGLGIAAAAAIAGMSPDLDLLYGRHSAETHSVGAAAIAGLLAWMYLRARRLPHAGAIGAMIALAVASHPLLDWVGTDNTPPFGIMALWPFTNDYYVSSAPDIFMAVSRRYWLPEFWVYNLRVLAQELAILGIPAAVIEWQLRRRSPR
jgi:inner membrane protein